jgi:thiol-disulfide isomerase/thioredoxin
LEKIIKWIKKRNWGDWLFVALIVLVVAIKGPVLVDEFKLEGNNFPLMTYQGKLFPPKDSKTVLIFWASWCGPCNIELNRIQKAITNNEISNQNIYAVNIGESPELVKIVVKERKYKIPIIFDDSGEIAKKLNILATPTLIFVDEKRSIKLITSGISPTLIYRIKHFLNK